MDNKKWYKRLNTVFWWVLAVMPLWCILLGFISIILFNNNEVILQNYSYDELYLALDIEDWFNANALFGLMNSGSLPFLKSAFRDLFEVLGVGNYVWRTFITVSLSWFVSVHIYHLIVDVLVWLPNMLHKLMEKYQD